MTRVYVMVCRLTVSTVPALAVVAALALAGCDDWIMGGVPRAGAPETAYVETPRSRYQTTSITVRAATPLRAAAAGAHADVDSIAVTVAGEDAEGVHQDPLDETELEQSETGWSGTLSGLTIGAALTFTAEARSVDDVLLFEGSTTATLEADTDTVVVGLASVDDATADRIPIVTGITVAEAEPGASATVQVAVSGSGGEELEYTFSGGSFTPASDMITLIAGAGTISSTYTAPANPGRYPAQVRVTNAQGNGVEVDFEIAVREATAQHSGPVALNTSLGPVVTSLAGKRTPAGVRWTASVSTPDDVEATIAWSFTGAGGFTDAAANPTILTGYDESTTGTLRVTVTDDAGLSANATLEITAGMFLDALAPLAAELVINEIDYDTPDTGDPYEFVEIYNPGAAAVDLTGYRVELVNGSNGEVYGTLAVSGELAGGGYFVIAKQAVIDSANPTFSMLLTEDLQNGPDAIRIVVVETGRVVDSVHYKGDVAGAGEGAPAGNDSAAASRSIGRCPDGFDSDDNSLDFALLTTTPGAANSCS